RSGARPRRRDGAGAGGASRRMGGAVNRGRHRRAPRGRRRPGDGVRKRYASRLRRSRQDDALRGRPRHARAPGRARDRAGAWQDPAPRAIVRSREVVTANEPPNPYSPPTSSSSDGRANAPPPAANAAESVRGAATAAALLGFPLGAGFYILGRRRPAVAFASAGILVGALATASIRAPAPKLFLIALGAAVGLWLAAALGTMKARPGPTPVRRAAPWTIVPIALALLINAAVKHWLIEAFQIPAGSMIPTLLVGDHVL